MVGLRKLAPLCLLAFALCLGTPFPAAAEETGEAVYLPSHPVRFLRGGKEIAEIQVEMAISLEEKRHGLMFRTSLPADAGMLFIYPRPIVAAMWMKNTLIPLDMVFMDEGRRVVHIHENAIPHDLTPISARQPVWAVLELNGGTARTLGLAHGDELHIEADALKPRSDAP